jgi:ribosomal protein L1
MTENQAPFAVKVAITDYGIRLPRGDIQKQRIRIFYDEKKANLPEDEKTCYVCMEEYFKKADYPVQLPCKHYICLADMITLYDAAGKLYFNFTFFSISC